MLSVFLNTFGESCAKLFIKGAAKLNYKIWNKFKLKGRRASSRAFVAFDFGSIYTMQAENFPARPFAANDFRVYFIANRTLKLLQAFDIFYVGFGDQKLVHLYKIKLNQT